MSNIHLPTSQFPILNIFDAVYWASIVMIMTYEGHRLLGALEAATSQNTHKYRSYSVELLIITVISLSLIATLLQPKNYYIVGTCHLHINRA